MQGSIHVRETMQPARKNEMTLAEGANGIVRLSPNGTHVLKRLKNYSDISAFLAEIRLLSSLSHE
jgi:hypothetical protein